MMSTTPARKASTVPEALDQIVAAGEVPSLRRASGTYEIEIEPGGGRWSLKVDRGTPRLEAETKHSDCAIKCNEADFIDIAQGRQNLVAAFLQGRVKCSGDLAFALDLRRLVPVAA